MLSENVNFRNFLNIFKSVSNLLKETPLLPLFVRNIGYVLQVEQRSVLSDNDCAVDQNLTTAHVLLDFNSAQRKGFWSARRLVCYNTTLLQ